jgi:hypothetical protein
MPRRGGARRRRRGAHWQHVGPTGWCRSRPPVRHGSGRADPASGIASAARITSTASTSREPRSARWAARSGAEGRRGSCGGRRGPAAPPGSLVSSQPRRRRAGRPCSRRSWRPFGWSRGSGSRHRRGSGSRHRRAARRPAAPNSTTAARIEVRSARRRRQRAQAIERPTRVSIARAITHVADRHLHLQPRTRTVLRTDDVLAAGSGRTLPIPRDRGRLPPRRLP